VYVRFFEDLSSDFLQDFSSVLSQVYRSVAAFQAEKEFGSPRLGIFAESFSSFFLVSFFPPVRKRPSVEPQDQERFFPLEGFF